MNLMPPVRAVKGWLEHAAMRQRLPGGRPPDHVWALLPNSFGAFWQSGGAGPGPPAAGGREPLPLLWPSTAQPCTRDALRPLQGPGNRVQRGLGRGAGYFMSPRVIALPDRE